MFLKEFYTAQNNHVSVDAEQASKFAKDVAHDFNPLQ